MEMVEGELAKISQRAVPFVAGGDHSITLPVLRAIKRKHGRVNLVHMDSHFDFWDAHWGERFTHGSWLRRAREEGLLKEVIQLGIRGSFPSKEDLKDGKRLSITTFTTVLKEPPLRLPSGSIVRVGDVTSDTAAPKEAPVREQLPGSQGPALDRISWWS